MWIIFRLTFTLEKVKLRMSKEIRARFNKDFNNKKRK